MSNKSRSVPRSAKEIFTLEYALEYERYSATPQSTYEPAVAVLAGLAGGIKDGEVVGEAGAGTGNSTIVLGESNPWFGRLLAFEPSGMSEIAQYKFGKSTTLPIPPGVIVDEEVIRFIERQKDRTEEFRHKVELFPNRAEYLPLPDEELDRLFACQVMHWLAFSDDDEQGEHPEYVAISLKEFSRVLKPRGHLLFDTSGHQFDFGEKLVEGKLIKKQHLLSHPFYLEFLGNFETELARRGYANLPINPNKIGKFNNVFDQEMLIGYLENAGFKTLSPESPEEGVYVLTQFPIDRDDFKARIKAGAQMNLFNQGPVTALPGQEKVQIIEEVLRRTVARSERLLDIQCLELVASFACLNGNN